MNMQRESHTVCEQQNDRQIAPREIRKAAPRPKPTFLTSELATAPIQASSLSIMLRTSRQAMKTRWFWYAVLSSLCWTAWAFTARIGSKELPPAIMQFVSAFGFLLVGFILVMAKKFHWRGPIQGISYALGSGILLGLGGLALYGAYRSATNASSITAITSLYPVVTVVLARVFLREKLNRQQVLGVFMALVAIALLSS